MNDLLSLDFESASKAVLSFLHQRLGFGLWMVTRTEGDDWIVLQAEDRAYGVGAGMVFPWADTFCSEMVKGNAPRVVPDSTAVPVYKAARIGQSIPIQAYIGVPLRNADGSLFGTLCAIDPARQPDELVAEQSLIELLAALLSTILGAELHAAQEARRIEQLEMEAHSDALTQLLNRRAWDRMMDREEERCRRYGNPAAVLMIDLDDLKRVNDTHGHAAGDALIVHAAKALRTAAREADIVARLGGDEFGILAVECDDAGAQALLARTRRALEEQGVNASVGVAIRHPSSGLKGASETADRMMYEMKRAT